MARSGLALLVVPLLLAGCDRVSELWSEARSAAMEARAERPEGWQSIEDESSATRLYYQFVSEKGQVRFVERLEDVPEPLRASVGFVKLDVPPPLSPGDAARARRAQRQQGGSARVASASGASAGVVLYSAEWCGACKKAKRYLARKGVDYEERDVDDPQHAEELLRRTGQRGIPVIDVGGRILTGFSSRSYDALLDRA
jgi:glutaredoxin 3